MKTLAVALLAATLLAMVWKAGWRVDSYGDHASRNAGVAVYLNHPGCANAGYEWRGTRGWFRNDC